MSESVMLGRSASQSFSSLSGLSGSEREKAIADIVSQMTLDEKIAQMSGNTPLHKQAVMVPRYNYFPYDSGENKRLGIPPIRFTDGPHGVSLNHSTCFPVSSARGATWDAELEERVGNVIGIEARAQGANYFGGVCINLIRHPAGGRSQESFGEDPHHVGVMGVALVKGVQKHAMACAKHYACNSIEDSRFFVDVRVDERSLREIYLPHFKRCVDAGVASVMSSYNQVNGDYCGHNGRLLTDILKNEWKFDGFVMSDFLLGIRDGAKAANAGLDIEMPITWRYGRKLKALVKKGIVSESTINDAVTRILRQKARFFAVGDSEYNPKKVACGEHIELAREVARKSIVLLKNENSALPINRDSVNTIAVIGKLANKINLGDLGSSKVRPPYTITPLTGIKTKAGNKINVIHQDGVDLDAAKRASREADATVIVAGLSGRDEGEYVPIIPPYVTIGGDRKRLNLSADSEALIKAVAAESSRCIVVLEGGSAIIVESWIDDVEAVLMAWYPGMEGGNAIAEALFGDINPSGKLPMVFAKSENQLPPFDNKAKSVVYDYYHGYRLFDKKGLEPRFAFGFGLSYTTFKYENLRLNKKEIGKTDTLKVSVDITNTGAIAGNEIGQIYVGYSGSKVDRPVRELKGFGKLALDPGETKTLIVEINAEDLAYYDAPSAKWVVEEIEYIVHAGPSSRREDLQLKDSFRIV